MFTTGRGGQVVKVTKFQIQVETDALSSDSYPLGLTTQAYALTTYLKFLTAPSS